MTITLKSKVRVRFAPSPTGTLHIGSARTALFNYAFARRQGGTFVLRIEDTDVARSKKRHEQAIIDDLRWLGLDWDEGPDVGGAFGPYRQSERLELYREQAGRLLEAGAAYHCFCSEERLAESRAAQIAQGVTPRYDGRCRALGREEVERRLAAGEPAVVRFAVPGRDVLVHDLVRGDVVIGGEAFGDFIILRSDGTAGYNFAVVCDDAAMGITHVIRGDDHLTNTARQLLLFAALGAPAPVYAHHAMVLGPDGAKLSKRHGATAVGEYRELGYLPQAVVNYLALLSWSHGEREVLSLRELVEDFDPAGLSPSPSIFDQAKLDWLAHEHVLRLDPAEHERRFAERLPGVPPQAAAALAAAYQPSLAAYGQAPALAAAVLDPPALPAGLAAAVAAGAPFLHWFRAHRAAASEWLLPDEAREILAAYRAFGKQGGHKPRELLMPLRIALTSVEHGPELPYVLAALARPVALARLDAALAAAGTLAGEAPPAGAAQDPTTEGDQQ